MSHVAVMIPCIDRIAGAEQQALLLAKGLRARDWRVSVVALTGSGGTSAAELSKIGVEFVSLRMRLGLADPGGWLRFHSWLSREQPRRAARAFAARSLDGSMVADCIERTGSR